MSNNRCHSVFGKIVLWVLIGIFTVVAAIIVCNVIVKLSSRGKLYDNVNEIPYCKVGLVLGTSPYNNHGQRNLYYENRIKAAAQLYDNHKVSYILVSGDNRYHDYNEPEYMRRSLIKAGVPDSAIILDYAGFRTFDSVIRAKKVFGQDSITIISQPWHNGRAIFIARHNDLNAIGFNAKDVNHWRLYLKNHGREVLAKVKVVLDVIFNKQPKFLGEPVVVP